MSTLSSYPPILVIVFNRPQKTRALVDQLRAWNDLDILVAADGPRHEAERSRCDEVRAIVQELAAQHRLQTRFADRNLGCGAHVASAIRWALEMHDSVIILEDDIQISAEFLDFCRDGLELYRDRADIACLCGGPLLSLDQAKFPPVFLARYPNIWGWATWREAFEGYSITLDGYSVREIWRVLSHTFTSLSARLYFLFLLLLHRSGRIDSWDFQYYFLTWSKNSRSVTPARNLTQNIGFDHEGTHVKKPPKNVGSFDVSIVKYRNGLPLSPAPSDLYDTIIDRELYKIGFYRVARFVIKYIVTRRKIYRI